MSRSSAVDLARRPSIASLFAVAVALAPSGCFFPEFTFNADGGSGGAPVGGGGSGTTTSSMTGGGGSGGTTTTSMTTGGGGSGGMTTTSMMTGGGGSGGMMTGGGGTGGVTMTTTTTDTTTTTTTTTTTLPPVEDCVNGADDDGDLAVDCMDTECADHSCVASIPSGWTGYFLLYEGTAAADPGCTADFPMESYAGNFNLQAPAATCDACSCGAPQGEVCTPPAQLNVFDQPCGTGPTNIRPLLMPAGWGAVCNSAIDPGTGNGYYWAGGAVTCGPNDTDPCNVSIASDAPTVAGGFCAASGGAANVTPATWGGFARACGGPALTGKGCALNQTCLPKPEAPYVGGLCIRKSGNVNCPAGMFNTKHLYFDDFTDSRTCTNCQCGTSVGGTCAGNITSHADSVFNQCFSPVATFQAGTCMNLTGNPSIGNSKFVVTAQPTGGACQPSGGMPSGTAVGTFPQTFCCIDN